MKANETVAPKSETKQTPVVERVAINLAPAGNPAADAVRTELRNDLIRGVGCLALGAMWALSVSGQQSTLVNVGYGVLAVAMIAAGVTALNSWNRLRMVVAGQPLAEYLAAEQARNSSSAQIARTLLYGVALPAGLALTVWGWIRGGSAALVALGAAALSVIVLITLRRNRQ